MEIYRHPRFDKRFKVRVLPNPKLAKRFEERVKFFLNNPQHPLLKDHQLTGNKKSLRAFSLGGDLRVVYKPISNTEVLFIDIGTHNQVY